MGSTNGPVENTQWRTAPGPRPVISARIGYAIPARKIVSCGGGISANVTTCSQTLAGGAFTSIEDFTSNTPGCGFRKYSAVKKDGVIKKTMESAAGVCRRPQ